MVWILLTFMIYWDHPNLLTLYSSAYKRRGALMEKIELDEGLSCLVAWSFWSLYGDFAFCFVKIDCE
jgi:hypothetical protein